MTITPQNILLVYLTDESNPRAEMICFTCKSTGRPTRGCTARGACIVRGCTDGQLYIVHDTEFLSPWKLADEVLAARMIFGTHVIYLLSSLTSPTRTAGLPLLWISIWGRTLRELTLAIGPTISTARMRATDRLAQLVDEEKKGDERLKVSRISPIVKGYADMTTLDRQKDRTLL